jgi:hypothetical protein
VTPGADVAAVFPNGLGFDTLGALQRGSFANRSIEAAAFYVKASVARSNLPGKPRLGVEYDYASGNPRGEPQRMGTFDQQYPSNHNAFGLTDLFGFQNIKEERINFDLTPLRNLAILIQQESLQVASRYDNVYSGGASTVIQAPASGFRSGDLGHEFDASAKYVFHDYLVFNAGVGHLSPGTLLRQNGHGPPLTLAYFSVTYRFKLNGKHGSPGPAP